MSKYPDFWRGSLFPSTFSEMDRLVEDWINRKDQYPQSLSPKTEVTEDKNHYHFKMDIPGIPKDQIKIEFHDQNLIISGERKEEKYDDSKKRHLSEVSYGSFLRTFTIPGPIRSDNIQAEYDHGVLRVTVPKSEVTKAKQILVR